MVGHDGNTLATSIYSLQYLWLRLASPQHSPTCTAARPGWRIPQDLPLQSVGGREEVSLCPRIIVAHLLATAGSMDSVDRSGKTVVAPFHLSLIHAGNCTNDIAIRLSRFSQEKNFLPITVTKIGQNVPSARKFFQIFSRRMCLSVLIPLCMDLTMAAWPSPSACAISATVFPSK